MYTSEPISRPSRPCHLNVHIKVDPRMVGKGVLVCCATSLRKWSFLLWSFTTFRMFRPLTSGSVMIIGDFWQPFCVGKNNGGHKARPRKTTIARGKIYLTQLGRWSCSRGWPSWSPRHLREQLAVALFCSRKKAQNITDSIDYRESERKQITATPSYTLRAHIIT